MKYFRVEKGKVVEGPRSLPTSWGNVSGLDKATSEELVAYGWLPEDVQGFEPFDDKVQTRTGPAYVVHADRVVSQYTIKNRSQAELAPLIKGECARRIYEVTKDQVTMMNMTGYASELIAKAAIDAEPLTAEDQAVLATLRGIRGWVEQMQAAARVLIVATDLTYEDDSHWPKPPSGAAAIVGNF